MSGKMTHVFTTQGHSSWLSIALLRCFMLEWMEGLPSRGPVHFSYLRFQETLVLISCLIWRSRGLQKQVILYKVREKQLSSRAGAPGSAGFSSYAMPSLDGGALGWVCASPGIHEGNAWKGSLPFLFYVSQAQIELGEHLQLQPLNSLVLIQ